MKISDVIGKLIKMLVRYGDIDTCIEDVLDNTVYGDAKDSAIIGDCLIFHGKVEDGEGNG